MAFGLKTKRVFQKLVENPENLFIRTKMKGIHISLAEYGHMLNILVLGVRGRSFAKIIVGYFTMWALEWSSRTTNVRTHVFLEAFTEQTWFSRMSVSYTYIENGAWDRQ